MSTPVEVIPNFFFNPELLCKKVAYQIVLQLRLKATVLVARLARHEQARTNSELRVRTGSGYAGGRIHQGGVQVARPVAASHFRPGNRRCMASKQGSEAATRGTVTTHLRPPRC
jgi:hypothetical protein